MTDKKVIIPAAKIVPEELQKLGKLPGIIYPVNQKITFDYLYEEYKEHCSSMDIICFEYILLEFKNLLQWIYAPDDEFLIKRKSAIKARELLLICLQGECLEYKNIRELAAYDEHIDEHNIEQLAAKLLFDLTRNTGFEVSKGKIGECWLKACCEWREREQDDICGLDSRRMSIYDKMKSIYEGTCLKNQFHMAGLEVTL